MQTKQSEIFICVGSVLTDKFNDKSDIDLLVDIDSNDPLDYADYYFNLKFALQELIKRPIDLLESKAMKNPYNNEAEAPMPTVIGTPSQSATNPACKPPRRNMVWKNIV